MSIHGCVCLLGAVRNALEQTTTANVGSFPVPLGGGQPLRQTFPSTAPKKSKKRKPQASGTVVSYDDLNRWAREQIERLER